MRQVDRDGNRRHGPWTGPHEDGPLPQHKAAIRHEGARRAGLRARGGHPCHRDVKTRQVLLGPDSRAVAETTSARHPRGRQRPHQAGWDGHPGFTATGTHRGRPGYTAPNCGAGATLYAAVEGRGPSTNRGKLHRDRRPSQRGSAAGPGHRARCATSSRLCCTGTAGPKVLPRPEDTGRAGAAVPPRRRPAARPGAGAPLIRRHAGAAAGRDRDPGQGRRPLPARGSGMDGSGRCSQGGATTRKRHARPGGVAGIPGT